MLSLRLHSHAEQDEGANLKMVTSQNIYFSKPPIMLISKFVDLSGDGDMGGGLEHMQNSKEF
jgi:hypothetical protein